VKIGRAVPEIYSRTDTRTDMLVTVHSEFDAIHGALESFAGEYHQVQQIADDSIDTFRQVLIKLSLTHTSTQPKQIPRINALTCGVPQH